MGEKGEGSGGKGEGSGGKGGGNWEWGTPLSTLVTSLALYQLKDTSVYLCHFQDSLHYSDKLSYTVHFQEN